MGTVVAPGVGVKVILVAFIVAFPSGVLKIIAVP